jgi:hypothetical protein
MDKSRFTEHLTALNGLPFRKWVFEPGMLFLSEFKWWGDKGHRNHPHNGLDLRLYETVDGALKTFNEGTKIPIMYEGKIVRIVEDFLGCTLFAAHEIYERSSRLFTIYGHVQQTTDVDIVTPLTEGTAVARLTRMKSMKVPAHLHLSVAFIPKIIPFKDLTWEILNGSDDILFLDPELII